MNDKKEVLGGFEMNQKTIDTYEMKVNRLVAEKIKLRSEIGQLKAEIEQHKLSHVMDGTRQYSCACILTLHPYNQAEWCK